MREDLLALLATAWPSLPDGIARARSWPELGAEWDTVSMPFLVHDGDRPVAHVGVTMLALHVGGSTRAVPALHAVCVHPDHRGRGLARRAIADACAWIEARGDAPILLWSEKDAFYARFGFRPVVESVWEMALVHASERTRSAGRVLDPDVPADRRELAQALATREPISDVAGAADPGWLFGLDLALWVTARGAARAPRIVALPDDDALVVGRLDGDVLCLDDIVCAGSPPSAARAAAALLASVGGASTVRRLRVMFTPDRLPDAATLRPRAHPDPDVLQVRGDLDVAGPFAFSPLART